MGDSIVTKRKDKLISSIALTVLALFLVYLGVMVRCYNMPVMETYWALTPPVIAIALALITKEVYSSLFLGILTGALLWSGFEPVATLNHIFKDGIIAVLSDSWNVGILIFLVILGMMVQLMNRAGGSSAFGKWASKHIKTRAGAQLATIFLGMMIFIDDYFNCLTVGSVMRPVTDQHQISRAKLAYLIDSTAAPICIIAPISSWAAAVSGFVQGENGLNLFIQAIPFNFYALLTMSMMILLVVMKEDFGLMAAHEKNAMNGDLLTTHEPVSKMDDLVVEREDGHVLDMLVPIFALIACCVVGMIYTGGYFSEGKSFVDAFANSDASVGLVLGSSVALVLTLIFYLTRQVMPFEDCMLCLPDGFKQMVPAILILSFAWALKATTDNLGAAKFVAGIVQHSAGHFLSFLPCIIFLIAIGLAFATGTSWGTFGILIPIVVSCFQGVDYQMMIISISACMAGAVCGDHCSPISDTTIMSSAGAQCLHINHVTTQLPYALTVAFVSFLTYIVAGFTKSAPISLVFGFAALLVVLLIIKRREV